MTKAIVRAGCGAAAFALMGAAILFQPGVAAAADAVPLLLAQASGRQAPAQQPRAGAAGNQAQQQPNAAGKGQDVEKHIADLRRQLKITPAQEAQFNAFADVMRSNEKNLETAMQQQQSQGQAGNALDELRSAEKFAEANLEALRRLVPVFQALY